MYFAPFSVWICSKAHYKGVSKRSLADSHASSQNKSSPSKCKVGKSHVLPYEFAATATRTTSWDCHVSDSDPKILSAGGSDAVLCSADGWVKATLFEPLHRRRLCWTGKSSGKTPGPRPSRPSAPPLRHTWRGRAVYQLPGNHGERSKI